MAFIPVIDSLILNALTTVSSGTAIKRFTRALDQAVGVVTLAKFQVPEAEQRDVVAFVQSLKKEIIE